MKKIMSKISVFLATTAMMLLLSPVGVFATGDGPNLGEDALQLDQLYGQLFSLIEGYLIILGISVLVPTIICLFIILFADRGDSGNGRSMFNLIGVGALMCLPVVSVIMLFIWAFGSKTKADPTFRNWARLMLLAQLYSIIFFITLYVTYTLLVIMPSA